MAPHALPVFLLVLLTGRAGGRPRLPRGLQRRRASAARTEARDQPRLVLSLALGFAAIVAAAALFAGIAERATPTHTLGRADQVLADGIAATLPWAARCAPSACSRTWATAQCWSRSASAWPRGCCGAATPAWRWAGCWRWAATRCSTRRSRIIFERARPVHDHGLAFEDGYSFPSGHSSGADGGLRHGAVPRAAARRRRAGMRRAVMAAVAVILTTRLQPRSSCSA